MTESEAIRALREAGKRQPLLLEAAAVLAEMQPAEGGYVRTGEDGDGSVWRDDLSDTLAALATRFRAMKGY